MSKKRNKRSIKTGLPPGSLVHVGEINEENVKISVIDFTEHTYKEESQDNIIACSKYLSDSSTTWINLDGVHDVDIIKSFGNTFNIHPLVLEDITNTNQRPKFEDYDVYLFLISKSIHLLKDNKISSEQISLIILNNCVISFQQRKSDIFNQIRERIINN